MPATIVIADDDPDILDLLQVLLEGEGHTTIRAHDGREALDLLIRHRPQLLITDHQMPEMTGAEILEYLAAHPELTTPTLVVSAVRPAPPPPPPPNLFLAKPFDLDELLEKAAILLNGGGRDR